MVQDVKYSKDGLKYEVVTPGLAFDDFDRTGKGTLTKVSPFHLISYQI